MTTSERPEPETEDAPLSRVDYIRRQVDLPRQHSKDGSANQDSLFYLANFARGEVSSPFYVTGAIRCSGTTPEQLTRIVELLPSVCADKATAETFVKRVECELLIPVRSLHVFPSPPVQPSPENDRQIEEFHTRLQIQARAQRKQAQEDEDLDKVIAELLGVGVVKLENEWGWKREDTAEYYSPTSSRAIAFELIERFRLDVSFLTDDVVVTFHVPGMDPSAFSVYRSSAGNSLPRAVAVAAYRKAMLERRVS